MKSVNALLTIVTILFLVVILSIAFTTWYSGIAYEYTDYIRVDIEYVYVYENNHIVLCVCNYGTKNISIDYILIDNGVVKSNRTILDYKGDVYLGNLTNPPKIFLPTGSQAIIAFYIPSDILDRLKPDTMHEIGIHLSNGYVFEKLFVIQYNGTLGL